MPCPEEGPIKDTNGFVNPREWIETKEPDTLPLQDIDFKVFIGGKEATAYAFLYHPYPRFTLLVYPPKQDAPGLYDLEVKYQDLSAKEPQAVRYTSLTAAGNVSAVLVIDRTGSMSGEKIALAKSAASQFVSLMNPGDEIGVVSYSTALAGYAGVEHSLIELPSKEREKEKKKKEIQDKIDNIPAGGWTSIGAGISKGQEQLNLADPGNPHAMILLSDGLENTSPWVADVLPTIPEKTDIYTIAFGTDADRELMQKIAVRTGGWFYDSYDPRHVIEIYNRIAGQLTGQQTILSQSNKITQGATDEIKSWIDSTIQKIIFMLGWSGSDLDLTLVRPDGTVIDQAVATTDPSITFRSGTAFESYEITSPMPGEWKLRVKGVDVPQEGEDYTAMVMGIAGLTLEAYFDKDYYIPNESITILASLLEDGSPVANAAVKVEISRPDRSTATLTLFDDGLHGDGSAADGIYGNLYTETSMKGSYTFVFQASGNTSAGEPFNRTLRRSLFLGDPIGSISGEVFYEGKQQGKVYVQAWIDDPAMRGDPAYQVVINQPGSYSLEALPDGTYYLAAYLDSNGNGEFDRLEPRGIFGISTPEPVIIISGEAVTKIFIILYEIPLVVVARYVEDCPQGAEDPDKLICRKEIEFASWLYLTGQEVPGTGGKKIDLNTLREMVSYYLTQTPIDQTPPGVQSQQIEVQLRALLGEQQLEELKVERVMAIPNSIRNVKRITFKVSGSAIRSIQVEIYDLSGRRVFDSGEVPSSTLVWNLVNNNGRIVANGVYLYLITVKGFNDKTIRSKVKKLIVLR